MNEIRPGSEIGVYQLTEPIGKGGFSEVWSAWDSRLKRVVAIKIIFRDAENAQNIIRFHREALIITLLEHPHILPLYDFGELDAYRYLVMRYVTHGSLADKLRNGALAPAEIMRLMTPIAETLDYIHEQQVVHRDLKPANILLDAHDIPYLADFGLSKQLTEDTRPLHSASGTYTYMPPEQFNGGFASAQSDQYSFGILLFQLFTGSLPMGGDFVFALRQIGQGDTLPSVTDLNPNLPIQLTEILRELTTVDPNQRPASASAVMGRISALFAKVGIRSGSSVLSISAALESGEYRQKEAESLIERYLSDWRQGIFSLSRTHFTLLNMILGELPALLTSEVRSLMLRGALEFGDYVEEWWVRCDSDVRQLACFNALVGANEESALRAARLAAKQAWAANTPPEAVNRVSRLLMPESDRTEAALDFLEKALPPSKSWVGADRLVDTDVALHALALRPGSAGSRAARVIGRAHRTQAATFPADRGHAGPLLTVYESAGSLPPGYSVGQHIQLTLMLALRQLIRDPAETIRKLPWAVAGNGLAIALMVFSVYRRLTVVDVVPILNAVGQGLLFGTFFGLGIWSARQLSSSMTVLPTLLRAMLGAVVGGLIVALGVGLFQRLVYDDVLDSTVAFGFGALYVAGFAFSVRRPGWVQVVAGMVGISAAFLIPWWAYLSSDGELRIPFFFDESAPDSAVRLVLFAALCAATLTTLGPGLDRNLRKQIRDNSERRLDLR